MQNNKINNVLIIGATSAIANEVARIYAARHCNLTLLGRNESKLQAIQADLSARGAGEVNYYTGKISDNACIEELFSMVAGKNVFDVILIAYGMLGKQAESQENSNRLSEIVDVNFTSAAIWCENAVRYFEGNKKGCLAVIGSIAGDRGRKRNYIYGSAKAGLDIFLAGMRHRLAGSGIKILTIKPGFVDTPMTDGMNKSGLLWASPQAVARDIVTAIDKGRTIIYTPWFWRLIMLIIKYLPASIFNRLDL